MKDSEIEWIGNMPEDWGIVRMKSSIAKRDSGAWGEEADITKSLNALFNGGK